MIGIHQIFLETCTATGINFHTWGKVALSLATHSPKEEQKPRRRDPRRQPADLAGVLCTGFISAAGVCSSILLIYIRGLDFQYLEANVRQPCSPNFPLMAFLPPVTPGFLISLAATLCLAVIFQSVPFLKSVYFVKVNVSTDSCHGDITLGTLGYCLNLCHNNGTTCSKPSVGYVLGMSPRSHPCYCSFTSKISPASTFPSLNLSPEG